MEAFSEMWEFFSSSESWQGSQGIPTKLLEHLWLSAASVATAFVVAFIAGLYIGHRRRFEFIAITIANVGRALPSFAILAIGFSLALRFGISFEFWPAFAAMFLLAIPPILINTYTGVREVDADTLEAARGMGLSERQILREIEIPLAAPLIVGGIRTSAVQVVATATLAALVAGPGLGRFIVDGFARNDDGLKLAGAALVAILAIGVEAVLAVVERGVRPGGSGTKPGKHEFKQAGQAPRPAGF